MLKIKKNDRVVVIAGKDKGKTGKVTHVYPNKERVVVEKVNIIKKTQKRTQDNQEGGFMEVEAPIHISNVMLIDKKTNKPSRFGVAVQKDGSKKRISRRSGEVI